MGLTGPGLALAALLVAAALALDWALRRLGRRVPRALARQRAAAGRARPAVWERLVGLAVLAARLVLWTAAAFAVSAEVPALESLRAALVRLVSMSLHAPLFSMSDRDYSAIDLVALPALIVASWAAVSALTRVVQSQVLEPAGVERGVQEALGTIARALLTFVASVVVLQAWGVDVRSLAILGSVLGVGIGFGLQHIANNLVSGLVLAMERPVRPGDFVQVGDFRGTVRRVGGRSTVIETLDQVTILVPNARLLESEVVNWSYGSPVTRLHVPVGVAYGSDLGVVRRALLEAAREHPGVLRDPRPQVQLREFADSAVNVELLAWTARPQEQFTLVSDLNFRIERSLRTHGVHIPFPQRDLHLRSPVLDRVVAALGRQLGEDAEERIETADETPALEAAPLAEDAPGWSDADLDALVTRMRGPDGPVVVDRRHLLTLYPQCFVGSEAVTWLCEQTDLTRAEAVALGERLVERGDVRHVLDEHGFRDGRFFYRFVGKGPSAARDSGPGGGIETPHA